MPHRRILAITNQAILRKIKLYAALLTAVFVVGAGCSGSGGVRYDSPEEAYTNGKRYFEEGKYLKAIEFLQGSFDFGPTHEFAADAQLMLARAYAANKDYLLAANEYNRFIQIYRLDPRIPEAEFEYAMTFFHRSPQYQLDQTETEKAVRQFQLFIDKYPRSQYVADAENMIRDLREKLGRKAFESGRLYERRDLFQAAAVSYEQVFDKYPDTVWADDALLGAVRVYIQYARNSVESKQAERYDKALENYQRLRQLFPAEPVTLEAEKMIKAAGLSLDGLASGS